MAKRVIVNMGTKANQVSRLELFVEIAKVLELETNVSEEPNGVSVNISKGEVSLKVIFGDFSKVRIWKKFAFSPANIMEEFRRAEELLRPLAHAFDMEWKVLRKKLAALWPLESQTDQNFLLETILEHLEKDPDYVKELLSDRRRNYFVRKSLPHLINDWPEFTKQRSQTLLKILDDATNS